MADIVVFHPDEVTGRSTWNKDENELPSTGIPWVLVHGVVMVRDSEVRTDAAPGQAIRFDPLPRSSYDGLCGRTCPENALE